MHIYNIPELNKQVEYPALQEEMTGKQRILFITLALRLLNLEIDRTEFKRLLLIDFLNIKVSSWYKHFTPESIKLTINDNINRLADQLDSLFEIVDNSGVQEYHLDLENIKQFLPVIKIGRKKYYGPADALTDCTFYEYRTAVYCYKIFAETKNDADLDNLIAVLYRPKKSFFWIRKHLPSFNGIIRQSITSKTNPSFLSKRAKIISKLPIIEKEIIRLYFSGCLKYLRTGKPVIDGNEISFDVLYKGASTDDDGIGMSGLLFSLAETKVFGEIDTTDSQNLYTIFARLYQVMKQQEKMKELYKSKNHD
jgi:hypothetical protein